MFSLPREKGNRYSDSPIDDEVFAWLANEPVKTGRLFSWAGKGSVYNGSARLCQPKLREWAQAARAGMKNPFRYFDSSPEVIRLVVMMYVKYPLSLRNVEDLLAERGIDICHETVRLWWNHFGPMFAAEIRKKRVDRMRAHSQWRWHLDEVYVKINGEMHYLWRAIDHEGEVLESFASKSRDKAAALNFIKRAMKRHGNPKAVVTDGLRSYSAAMEEIGNADRQEVGRWINNRAENSHQPFRRRERAMLRFRRMKTLQKFASIHGTVHNHFNQERHLTDRQTFKANRSAALAEWKSLIGQGPTPLPSFRENRDNLALDCQHRNEPRPCDRRQG